MHVQLPCDQQEMADLRLSAVLNSLDRAAVDPSELGQPFLRKVELQPLHAHAVADRPSGVEDPLLVWGRHPTNAATKMILCPQQN